MEGLLLPVSFQNTYAEFRKHWLARGPYKAVVMLGQAAGRKAVEIERVALNWMESKHPDNEGITPRGQRIVREAPDSYIMDFFPPGWVDILSQQGPAEISFSAGAYVCNQLYFQVAHELKPLSLPSLFVHLPLLPEQIKPGDPLPALALETQSRIVSSLLDLIQTL